MSTRPKNILVPFPSGPPCPQKLSSALTHLRSSWKQFRFTCPWTDRARSSGRYPYLAGEDEERLTEFTRCLGQPDAVVWCGRGGYGATRLLTRLNGFWKANPPGPGRLLGYSDITALFALLKSMGSPIECVHAPVLCEIEAHPKPEVVSKALMGEATPLPVRHPSSSLENFEAPIWGGNLAVLASLAGTPWLPSLRGVAVLLEDVDEAPYRLDRFLTQLAETGQLNGNAGILLGEFTNCGDADETRELLSQRCQELGWEVLGQVPVGHQPWHLPVFLDRTFSYNIESQTLHCKV